MKFCTKCGSPISDDMKICPKCEQLTQNEIPDLDAKSKVMKRNLSKNNIPKKRSSNFTVKILIGLLLFLVVLVVVFFNKIKGEYYIYKYKNTEITSKKIDYAVNAVKTLETSNAKDLLKNSLIEMSKTDIDTAETKLKEVSSLLSKDEYQSIAGEIKENRINKLYAEGRYEDIIKEFVEINKLGGDFKSNVNYDNVMLNISSKITNTRLENSKGLLMKYDGVYYDDFDGDSFDEIIHLQNMNYNYGAVSKLDLYKITNGQYKVVDTKTFSEYWNSEIQGVYEFAKGVKGAFIHYSNSSGESCTSVFGFDNKEIIFKGAVIANNYTMPDDIDRDGIYEVVGNNLTASSSTILKKWFKIYEDGRTPTEVKSVVEQVANVSNNSNEYIFEDSYKRYLTDGDLMWLSKEELAIARNEIFARHGYVFKMDEFKDYFNSKSWYVPNPNYDGSDSALNEYEIANYMLIQEWEKKY
ncbi:YARHG domain-containing protein [Clostridium sp. 'White wine YQ']|uniref:YARHG domain-containing protein n=1 Tax=Clostridium sp. 'White wine YQ' TaxID=3027474 RepID=UPI002365E9D7|nr:YARHG domain-containing protein [Clostridium sp. 'White wine YQ']MDD7792870.1 YARHG domain-containing protein [Clostridium sp. 'White wine YQ']